MKRALGVLATAITVLLAAVAAGIVLQILMVAVPYFASCLAGSDPFGETNAFGSAAQIGVMLSAAGGVAALAGAASTWRGKRLGVVLGLVAYPVLCAIGFLVPESPENWVRAVAYSQAFVAFPFALVFGTAWALFAVSRRLRGGRQAPGSSAAMSPSNDPAR